jgi:hypothetical protein
MHIADGMITRQDVFSDRRQALEIAGLMDADGACG